MTSKKTKRNMVILAAICIAISSVLLAQKTSANGYTLCCRDTNDCADNSCCSCFDSGSNGCGFVGPSYTSCPSDAGGCVAAGCGYGSTTTTTTVLPVSDCRILTASLSSTCPAEGCRPGDKVKMSGKYSGECSEENFFQIDAVSTDHRCDIKFIGGDMQGITDFSSYCSCGSVTGYWTIPFVPPQCAGKTIVPTYAALYHGGPPGTGYMLNDTRIVSGSFNLAQCACSDWTDNGCGEGSCDGGYLNQTRTCVPDGCGTESRCVPPSWSSQDLGCGISCADKGQCSPLEQCQHIVDQNNCAADSYACTPDDSCAFKCDGSDVLPYHMSARWNSLSIPCSSVDIVTDDCGVGGGNFYFYDGNTGKWNVSTVGITTLKKGIGYWFYSTKACDFSLMASAGAKDVTRSDININSGWNQIAGPTKGLSDILNSLKVCNDCTDGLCRSLQILQYSSITRQWTTPNALSPGQGYSVQCVD